MKRALSCISSPAEVVHVTDAEAVREFTAGAGQPTPETPVPMTRGEVEFIGKMIVDELLELYATVMGPEEAKSLMMGQVHGAKSIPQIDYTGKDAADVVADQADALVDIYYYSLNAAAKKGVNMSSIFRVVHDANMSKRDPATGKFIKREDGKIIKPAGWQPPDVTREIRRQMAEGAFPAKENAVLPHKRISEPAPACGAGSATAM